MYVCICCGLTDSTVSEKIAAGGITSHAQLHEACGCQSNCKRCYPTIQAMIDNMNTQLPNKISQLTRSHLDQLNVILFGKSSTFTVDVVGDVVIFQCIGGYMKLWYSTGNNCIMMTGIPSSTNIAISVIHNWFIANTSIIT